MFPKLWSLIVKAWCWLTGFKYTTRYLLAKAETEAKEVLARSEEVLTDAKEVLANSREILIKAREALAKTEAEGKIFLIKADIAAREVLAKTLAEAKDAVAKAGKAVAAAEAEAQRLLGKS